MLRKGKEKVEWGLRAQELISCWFLSLGAEKGHTVFPQPEYVLVSFPSSLHPFFLLSSVSSRTHGSQLVLWISVSSSGNPVISLIHRVVIRIKWDIIVSKSVLFPLRYLISSSSLLTSNSPCFSFFQSSTKTEGEAESGTDMRGASGKREVSALFGQHALQMTVLIDC